MASIKPANARGTRDFLPIETAKRQYIFGVMRNVFTKYGFSEIETPAMEQLTTLTGKYGDEGDKLLFKILDNGDFLSKIEETVLLEKNSNKLISQIAEKGLRYDLTVPLARYVAQHQNELTFPFKRFHIAPVWRADRPQKGRYREFYQCDCDIVGSNSLLYEVELIQIYDEVLTKLGLQAEILINNRKILQGLVEHFELHNHFVAVTVIVDKWDKIGENGVRNELQALINNESKTNTIIEILQINNVEQIGKILSSNTTAQKGVEEIQYIFEKLKHTHIQSNVIFDLKLARGLNYYTGAIMEVKAQNTDMGSIGGAGRYDNLTETFGLKNMSGVGCSFGAERIFDIMEAKQLFPTNLNNSATQCLFVHFDEASELYCFKALQLLRSREICAEIYPEKAKLAKQMKYADDKKIPYVIIAGENELQSNSFTLKNMQSGEQSSVSLYEIIQILK